MESMCPRRSLFLLWARVYILPSEDYCIARIPFRAAPVLRWTASEDLIENRERYKSDLND